MAPQKAGIRVHKRTCFSRGKKRNRAKAVSAGGD